MNMFGENLSFRKLFVDILHILVVYETGFQNIRIGINKFVFYEFHYRATGTERFIIWFNRMLCIVNGTCSWCRDSGWADLF